MSNFLKVAAVLLISITVFAETGTSPTATKAPDEAKAQAQSGMPSRELAEAYFKRMYGYDPSLDVKVLSIAASPIPELAEVTVLFTTSEGKQGGKWYVSKDMRHAIVGEVLPFGADPFAPDREKLASSVNGPVMGPADSKMLIVEFADLECPACKSAAPQMQKLREDFPKARFVFQSFPLPQHPWAARASSYLDCIGQENQDRAYAFLDAVFSHQKEIEEAVRKTDADGKSTVDDAAVTEQLRQYASMVGADPGKTEACSVTPATAARIMRSKELGEAVGVTSTPTLFLNGRRVGSPSPEQYDALKSVVEFESAEAAQGK